MKVRKWEVMWGLRVEMGWAGPDLGVRVGDRDEAWDRVGLGKSAPNLCPSWPHPFLQHPAEVPTGRVLLGEGKIAGGL